MFVDSTKIFTPPKVNINALADGAKKVQEIREKRSNSAGESKLPRDVARLAEKVTLLVHFTSNSCGTAGIGFEMY